MKMIKKKINVNEKKKDGDQSKRPPKITKIIELNNESDKQKFLEALFGLNPIDPLEENDEKVEDVVEDVCPNPLCDCKDLSEGEIFIKKKITKINNINDLIELGKSYHCKKNTTFNNLDLKILCNLVKPLTDLNNMIGMEKVKKDMVNQIVFFLQGFNSKSKCNNCVDCSFGNECKNISNDDMLHTIITGPPGVGKTELGKILGYVYKGMGVLKKGTLKIVKRSDLIGKYLGHTAAKTQDVIDECSGGVMFIDEAYSLGNPDGKDSYSKECIDILNQNLSEEKCNFVCIIAGYADALKKSFFSYNAGLERRFPYRFKIKDYKDEELRDIFNKIVKEHKWDYFDGFNPSIQFFDKNKSYFKFFGGDLENYFNCCRIAHARRAMTIKSVDKKKLTENDLIKGLEFFIQNDEIKKRMEKDDRPDMYV